MIQNHTIVCISLHWTEQNHAKFLLEILALIERGSKGRSSYACTTSVYYGLWASTTSATQALCIVQFAVDIARNFQRITLFTQFSHF